MASRARPCLVQEKYSREPAGSPESQSYATAISNARSDLLHGSLACPSHAKSGLLEHSDEGAEYEVT